MSNAELVKYCEENTIEVAAKNAGRPTKAELIASIEAVAAPTTEDTPEGEGETLNDDFLAEVEAQQKEVPVENAAEGKLTKAQLKKKQFKELMKLGRYMITSNSDNQTKQPLITVSWGNRVTGYHTDRVILGKPWHVREGAIRNLRTCTIVHSEVDPATGDKNSTMIPAYNIADLGLLSVEEYKNIAEKQKLRDAALVN